MFSFILFVMVQYANFDTVRSEQNDMKDMNSLKLSAIDQQTKLTEHAIQTSSRFVIIRGTDKNSESNIIIDSDFNLKMGNFSLISVEGQVAWC